MACACGEHCSCGKRCYVDNTDIITNGDSNGTHSKVKEEITVHHVPFKIEYEGQASVDVKFTAKSVPLPSNSNVLCNQFRGRPLQGQKLDLPKEYEGLVATDLKKSSDDEVAESGEKTEILLGKRFDSLTYWNWDRVPSGMDKHVKLIDWLELSQVLHVPIEDV